MILLEANVSKGFSSVAVGCSQYKKTQQIKIHGTLKSVVVLGQWRDIALLDTGGTLANKKQAQIRI